MHEVDLIGDTWLVPAIGVTFLCCFPFGVVGIVYAVKAQSAIDDGEYVVALRRKELARAWTLGGFLLSLSVFFLSYIIGLERLAESLV